MKGCARVFLFRLAGFLATVAAVAFLLHRLGFAFPGTLGVSLLGGFFAFLALGFVFAIADPIRERAALRACLRGKRPGDGERTGITGTIGAATPGGTLRAPFTGTECLAFRYEIFEMRRIGRTSSQQTYFEGVALTPSVIETPAGSFRLLAVPTFDSTVAPEEIAPGKALFHWAEHVKTAPFEPDPKKRTLEKEWTDDDGQYRCEKSHGLPADVPIEGCRFRETLIAPGEKVYVVGRHSESKGGIVPDANWGNITRLMKGDGEAVYRKLGQRVVLYAVLGVVSAAASAGILSAFLSHPR